MTLLVSDEDDTVAPMLDYHLDRGVDFVIVTANNPTEEVLERVGPYVDAGAARLIHEESTEYAQARWVTRMARLAAEEHAADWVINADADEFFWPEPGTLKEVLAAVPERYAVLDVPMCHFLPRLEEGGFFVDHMTVRETRSLKPSGRALLTKSVHRAAPDVEVSMGNHRVVRNGFEVLREWQPVVGLHFPQRGYAHFERRVANDIRKERYAGTAARFGDRFELLRAGRLREAYEQGVPDADEVEEGIASGRLVRDERLKRFFAERAHDGAREPAGCDPERVAELRPEAHRAIVAWERHPLSFEAAELGERLGRAKSTVRSTRRRLEKSERRRARLKDQLAALRSTRTYRLGQRYAAVVALAAGVRRRLGGLIRRGG